MNKLFSLTLAAVTIAMLHGTASAQVVTGPIITSYRPIVDDAPTVTYSPVIESAGTAAPIVTYSPVVPQATTTYYQGPVTVARPIAQPTTTYAPIVAAPVVTYRPVEPVVAVPAPVVTYRPVTTVYAAPAPVIAYRQPVVAYAPALPVYSATTYSTYPTVVARPVVVSQKVYIPGQPVRNFFKAITP